MIRILFSKKINNLETSDFEEITLLQSGNYLLVVDDKAYKVIVK